MKDDFFARRLLDLAGQADRSNRFTFTDFLTEAEVSAYHAMRHTLPGRVTIWGGREDAERVMLRFGDAELLGYEEPFPITCLQISPLQAKFAEALTHRDYLGAMMHLGIERHEIGDILVSEHGAIVFCSSGMAEYLCRELTRIRHTSVTCRVTEAPPEETEQRYEAETLQVSSPRLDGVIAKAYRMSRGDCNALLAGKRVFVNSVCKEQGSIQLKEGDKVSVRGYGKLRYKGITGQTRKGNLLIEIERFI